MEALRRAAGITPAHAGSHAPTRTAAPGDGPLTAAPVAKKAVASFVTNEKVSANAAATVQATQRATGAVQVYEDNGRWMHMKRICARCSIEYTEFGSVGKLLCRAHGQAYETVRLTDPTEANSVPTCCGVEGHRAWASASDVLAYHREAIGKEVLRSIYATKGGAGGWHGADAAVRLHKSANARASASGMQYGCVQVDHCTREEIVACRHAGMLKYNVYMSAKDLVDDAKGARVTEPVCTSQHVLELANAIHPNGTAEESSAQRRALADLLREAAEGKEPNMRKAPHVFVLVEKTVFGGV